LATHVLDNPIWNSLTGSNQAFSLGNAQARYFNRDIAPFTGLKNNALEELDQLLDFLPATQSNVLFIPHEIEVSRHWKIVFKKALLQMVFDDDNVIVPAVAGLTPLTYHHVDEMLALTAQTKPGPFFKQTIEFGNYMGVFRNNRLAAMTGQRLQPGQYTEISAVCTHPNHVGKGYAAKLILDQVNKIRSVNRVPFLHLFADNTPAYNLYKKLGFKVRKELLVCVVEKQT
jgi:ribosomal protein S18 acetylase RimI-like enzyme